MFEITIKEIKTETQSGGKEWKLIGPESSAVYGYMPEIEIQVEVETKILQQVVESLDTRSHQSHQQHLICPKKIMATPNKQSGARKPRENSMPLRRSSKS